MTTDLKGMRSEEAELQVHVKELTEKLIKLEGVKEQLQKQNEEAAKKFRENKSDITTGKIATELQFMDRQKFDQMVDDVKNPKETYPAWKKHQFLEQPLEQGAKESTVDYLRKQKEVALQETNEISAGLEKAKQLLKLQEDIERENRLYY